MPGYLPGNVAAAILEAADKLDARGVTWVLGGSAGLALRGLTLPAAPRDVDLYIDEDEAADAHEALAAYAIDSQQFSETEIYRSTLSHYTVNGASLELVGGFVVRTGRSEYRTEVRDVLRPHALVAALGSGRVPVAPLAHELWFNALRGRDDRLKLVAAAMRGNPPEHATGLARIESRNRFAPELLAAVHELIETGPERGKERSDER